MSFRVIETIPDAPITVPGTNEVSRGFTWRILDTEADEVFLVTCNMAGTFFAGAGPVMLSEKTNWPPTIEQGKLLLAFCRGLELELQPFRA